VGRQVPELEGQARLHGEHHRGLQHVDQGRMRPRMPAEFQMPLRHLGRQLEQEVPPGDGENHQEPRREPLLGGNDERVLLRLILLLTILVTDSGLRFFIFIFLKYVFFFDVFFLCGGMQLLIVFFRSTNL